MLANLSPDSGNLANFASIWLQIFWLGDLAIFLKHLAPNFLVWRILRPIHLDVFAYIFICRFAIIKLAGGSKIHDIK